MSVIANLSILSSGMALGFPSVSIDALTQDDDPMKLSTEEVSWFGRLSHLKILTLL